jgi:hypothetical protein
MPVVLAGDALELDARNAMVTRGTACGLEDY